MSEDFSEIFDPEVFDYRKEESLFDNLDDLEVGLQSSPRNDEWLDTMRSEFEESVLKQVLKAELPSPSNMRRCDSLPAHMQFLEKQKPKGIQKVSSMASLGSKNLASMCSEVTITPTSSVPDLLDYERRHAALDKAEIGLGIERMKLNNGSFSPTMWSRDEALTRYRRKKNNRCFKKKIRYECRRKIASDRPRVGGRFARTEEEGGDVDDMDQYVKLEEVPSS
uniref:CCT domain-containing protein n=2 Tax=Rhodosorus marinus TaxID=101924 RepID=A0A6T6L7F7_9RHOD|mmetsp:Transcript_15216/g.22377  ORF Transcript_15216/g.22377 Transcript_15216/m.22377 type:complete len:223 (+) Transcript_15216:379-1047(+)